MGEILDLYIRCPDILLDDEVFIEVKHKLVDEAEFARLLRQIIALQPNSSQVIVVLVGRCDVELVDRLRQQFSGQLSGSEASIIGTPSMQAIQVPEFDEKQ